MDGAKGLTTGEISAHFAESCDGLTGLPEVVGNVWPQAIVQTYTFTCCATHFLSHSAINWDETSAI
jgi:transposase-like protein